MPAAFAKLLKDHLEKRGLSQQDFARLVRVSPSLISKAIRGKHTPRVKRAVLWAITLELNEAETRAFIEELELANSPDGVRRLVRRLRVQISKLERKATR